MSKRSLIHLFCFLSFFSSFLVSGTVHAEVSPVNGNTSVKRVLIIGDDGLKEVDVQALRDAANLVQSSHPEYSDEIRKAAEIVSN